MKYTIDNEDNIVIFTIKNDSLDSKISADFKAELLIICQPSLDALIIDMHSVQSIDSSGLGGLLLAYRQLHEHNIPVILVGIQEMVKKIMEISQIDDQFVFCKNLDEARGKVEDTKSKNR